MPQRTVGTSNIVAFGIVGLTLLAPLGVVGIIIVGLFQDSLYEQRCTQAVLSDLVHGSANQGCHSVPVSADWPTIVGVVVAVAMYVLYRRLSTLLADLTKYMWDPSGGLSTGSTLTYEGFASRTGLSASDIPSAQKYALKPAKRLMLFAVSILIGVAAYALYYYRSAWFHDLAISNSQAAIYRDNWWASWSAHPFSAVIWIVTAAGTTYLGVDNFVASSRLTLHLREFLARHVDELPFVANLPSRTSVWDHLQSFLGEIQYGAFTGLATATLLTILVVEPSQGRLTSVVVLIDLSFVVVLWYRFSIFKNVVQDTAMSVTQRRLLELEGKASNARASGDYSQAQYWITESGRVLTYGQLPSLMARQIVIRIVAIAVASVSFVATIAQTIR